MNKRKSVKFLTQSFPMKSQVSPSRRSPFHKLTMLTPRPNPDISETSYRISITLDVQSPSEDAPEPPTILLNVTYPESYPDVGPYLDITSPPNASRYPLLDVNEDKARLLESLEPMIEESLGMAMIFTLVSTLKESAEQLISDRQKQEEEVKEVAARKIEEEENRRFHGTAVTRERFLEWRANFRKEMEEKERLTREEEEADMKGRKGGGRTEEVKLTGRQLWERGLVGKVDVDDEEALEGENEVDIAKLKVTA